MSNDVPQDQKFAKYDNMDLVSLVVEMNNLRLEKESMEEATNKINEVYDFLRITKIPTVMNDEGIDRISVKGVGRVSITADMHVSIKADRKEAFYTWLRDNGRTDLISETVNPSTLKSSVKKMFRNGEIPPEDLLNISPFERASITKE